MTSGGVVGSADGNTGSAAEAQFLRHPAATSPTVCLPLSLGEYLRCACAVGSDDWWR